MAYTPKFLGQFTDFFVAWPDYTLPLGWWTPLRHVPTSGPQKGQNVATKVWLSTFLPNGQINPLIRATGGMWLVAKPDTKLKQLENGWLVLDPGYGDLFLAWDIPEPRGSTWSWGKSYSLLVEKVATDLGNHVGDPNRFLFARVDSNDNFTPRMWAKLNAWDAWLNTKRGITLFNANNLPADWSSTKILTPAELDQAWGEWQGLTGPALAPAASQSLVKETPADISLAADGRSPDIGDWTLFFEAFPSDWVDELTNPTPAPANAAAAAAASPASNADGAATSKASGSNLVLALGILVLLWAILRKH